MCVWGVDRLGWYGVVWYEGGDRLLLMWLSLLFMYTMLDEYTYMLRYICAASERDRAVKYGFAGFADRVLFRVC